MLSAFERGALIGVVYEAIHGTDETHVREMSKSVLAAEAGSKQRSLKRLRHNIL